MKLFLFLGTYGVFERTIFLQLIERFLKGKLNQFNMVMNTLKKPIRLKKKGKQKKRIVEKTPIRIGSQVSIQI